MLQATYDASCTSSWLSALQMNSALDRGASASSKGMTAGSSVAASSASTAKQGPLKQRALGDVVIGRPSTAVKVSEEATKRVSL